MNQRQGGDEDSAKRQGVLPQRYGDGDEEHSDRMLQTDNEQFSMTEFIATPEMFDNKNSRQKDFTP